MASTNVVTLVAEFKDKVSGPAKEAGGNVDNFGKTAAIAGAATVALGIAVVGLAKKMGDLGADIRNTSRNLSVSTEDYQALSYAFVQTGGSMETFGSAMRGVTTFMASASEGASRQLQVLSDLGMSYDDLAALDPAEQFLVLTDAIGKMNAGTEKSIAGATLFGARYSQQIIGTLNQTGGTLRQVSDDFKNSDMMIPAEDVETLAQFSDLWTELDTRMQALLAEAVVPLLPALTDGLDLFMDISSDAIPALAASIEGIMPILEGLTAILSLAAEGWSEILSVGDADSFRKISSDLEILSDILKSQVADGTITAAAAAEQLDNRMRALIGTEDLNVTQTMELVAKVTDLQGTMIRAAGVFNIFIAQSHALNPALHDIGASFSGIGTQLLNSLVDIDAFNAALNTIQEPTTGTAPDITDKKDIWISNIEKVAAVESERAEGRKAQAVEAYNNAVSAHNELLSMLREEMLTAKEKYDAEIGRIQELEILSGDHEVANRARLEATATYEEELHLAKVARMEELRELSMEIMNSSAALIEQIGNLRLQNLRKETTERKKSADAALAQEIAAIEASAMSEKAKAAAITAAKAKAAKQQTSIQEDAAKKEREIMEAQQPMKLAAAISNIALGVSKALSSAVPPFNLILAGITAAAGAVQIATIRSQGYAAGGWVQGQGTGDTVDAKLTPGEYVLTVLEARKVAEAQRSAPMEQSMPSRMPANSSNYFITIPYQPIFSSATPGEMVIFTEAVTEAIRMAGI